MYIYTVLCIAKLWQFSYLLGKREYQMVYFDFSISGWKTLKSYYLINKQFTDRLIRDESKAFML